jgi:predicted protein tyrosine phosphatase
MAAMPAILSNAETRLSICGLEELEALRDHSVTHVLSILDPDWPDPAAFADWGRHSRQVFRFHDVIGEYPGYVAPTREHVAEILRFGEELGAAGEPVEHFLVHCHAGISRSTAAMALVLAQARPDLPADAVFAEILRIRPKAWPNLRMIEFGDTILQRERTLVEAVCRLYGRQMERYANIDDAMIRGGRGREVVAGRLASA